MLDIADFFSQDAPRVSRRCFRRETAAFSLLELLAVITMIAVLSGLLAPAVGSTQSVWARKQAVSLLMETLDQARLMAVQSGQEVTVVLAKADDSVQGEDAIIVSGKPPLGAASSARVLESRWRKLPASVRFQSAADSLGTEAVTDADVLKDLPALAGRPSYACVVFNASGQVIHPANRSLKLVLFEGDRRNGQETARRGSLAANTPRETITLTRFTGRTQFSISPLQTMP